jgi:hypothetical protein
VKEPSNPVPMTNSQAPVIPAPVKRPSANEPMTLTRKVPNGNSPSRRAEIAPSIVKRATAPTPPSATRPAQAPMFTETSPDGQAACR